MKKVLIAVMVVVLFVTSVMFAADQLVQAKLANIRVLLNGSPIELKDATGAMVKPLSYKDTTYLPVRAISENLGLTVGWDEATQTISLTSTSESYDNHVSQEVDPTKIDHGTPFLIENGINIYKKQIGEEVKFVTINFKVNGAYETTKFEDEGYIFDLANYPDLASSYKLVVMHLSITNTTNKPRNFRDTLRIFGNTNRESLLVSNQNLAPNSIMNKIIPENQTVSGNYLILVPQEATEYYFDMGLLGTNKQFRFYLTK